MMRNAKVTVLTLVAVSVAGCAHSDRVVSRVDRPRWKPVKQSAATSLREVEPPKILPETHFAAACLHEHQGLVGEAIKQYHRAIALNHNYVQAYHRLGVLLTRLGRGDEAVDVLQRAVTLEPDDPTLRNDLGYAFMLQGGWEQARRELVRATELRPYFARAHVNLGMVLSRLGRFDEAFASFRAVLPEADARYNVGLMLRGQGRHQEAADAFRQVLAIDPAFTAAGTQLSEITASLTPVTPSESLAEAVIDDSQTRLPPLPRDALTLAEADQATAATPHDPSWFDDETPFFAVPDEGTPERIVQSEAQKDSEPISSPVWNDAEIEMISSPADPWMISSPADPWMLSSPADPWMIALIEDPFLFGDEASPEAVGVCEADWEVPEASLVCEAPVPAPIHEPDWCTTLQELEMQLAGVRTEIACWGETVAELETHPSIDVCFADLPTDDETMRSFYGRDIDTILATLSRTGDSEPDLRTMWTVLTPRRPRETMAATVVQPEKKK